MDVIWANWLKCLKDILQLHTEWWNQRCILKDFFSFIQNVRNRGGYLKDILQFYAEWWNHSWIPPRLTTFWYRMLDSNAHSLGKWDSLIYYDENKKVVHLLRVQCIPRWMDTIEKETLRVHLHQASALMLRQLCKDDSDNVLMESNAVAPEWGCNPFSSDFSGFKENSIASLQHWRSVDADAWCKRTLIQFGANKDIHTEYKS